MEVWEGEFIPRSGDRRLASERREGAERRGADNRRTADDRRTAPPQHDERKGGAGEFIRRMLSRRGSDRRRRDDRRASFDRRRSHDRRASHDREDRLASFQIDGAVIAELAAVRPLVAPRMDSILDGFYARLWAQKELPALLGEEGIARVRARQATHWLEHVFGGDLSDTFMQRAGAIGKTYQRIGLEPRWYMVATCSALNRVLDIVHEAHGDNSDRATATTRAVSKAMFLDMDLTMTAYTLAGDPLPERPGLLSQEELSVLLGMD